MKVSQLRWEDIYPGLRIYSTVHLNYSGDVTAKRYLMGRLEISLCNALDEWYEVEHLYDYETDEWSL